MKNTLLVSLLILICSDLICCSGFVFKNQNKLYMCANLDQEAMHGYIIQNKRNIEKFSFFAPPLNAIKWTSKYGSITFSAIGKDFPYGGMNEEGLTVAIMTTSPMVYQNADNMYEINESQWIQYVLDNYSTIAEVINSDTIIRIRKFFDNWHYLICDKSGEIAIIEYNNGLRKVYSGSEVIIPVLENSLYDKSLEGYRTDKLKNRLMSRFSQAAYLLENLDQSKLNLNEPKVMFSILDNVRQNITKWQMVYDIQNRKIFYRANAFNYLKSYGSKGFMWGGISEGILDFSKIDFNGKTIASKLGIYDVSEKKFSPFNEIFDNKLLEFNVEIFKSQGAKNITKEIIDRYIKFAKKEELIVLDRK